jgi:hypothetical protein
MRQNKKGCFLDRKIFQERFSLKKKLLTAIKKVLESFRFLKFTAQKDLRFSFLQI